MLACVHAEHSPEVRCPTDGGASACPEDWEMRHMYVVEATPRRDLGKQSGRLDQRPSSTWTAKCGSSPTSIPTIGRVSCCAPTSTGWRIAIVRFRMRSRDLSVQARVRGRRGFDRRAVRPRDDVLSAGAETPERECWYINMGAVDKDFFTIEAMVRLHREEFLM